jgi:hypothetical protein
MCICGCRAAVAGDCLVFGLILSFGLWLQAAVFKWGLSGFVFWLGEYAGMSITIQGRHNHPQRAVVSVV